VGVADPGRDAPILTDQIELEARGVAARERGFAIDRQQPERTHTEHREPERAAVNELVAESSADVDIEEVIFLRERHGALDAAPKPHLSTAERSQHHESATHEVRRQIIRIDRHARRSLGVQCRRSDHAATAH